jgi:vacuolar-type H+-ATPase subunit E/Vma4
MTNEIHTPNQIRAKVAYEVRKATLAERERIVSNIYDRISDLRSCHKNDNCVEFGELIESYVYEWTEDAHTSEPHADRPDTVTRLEVIDSEGRIYVKHDVSVELSYQDDNRTLKIFVSERQKEAPNNATV